MMMQQETKQDARTRLAILLQDETDDATRCIMSRSGNGSNSSDANTGTSIGATSRNKNAPGNRTDIGWKHGIDVFGNEVANASEKRRKLNSIHEEGIHTEGVESNTTQSGIEGKGMLAFKGRGKAKFVQASDIPKIDDKVLKMLDDVVNFVGEENVVQVKEGVHMCMRRLVKDVAERKKINLQLVEFHFARGIFSMEEAKDTRKVMQPGEWWEMFGDGTPELKRFAIHVLTLTCSSSVFSIIGAHLKW
ncbi:hypothetical protein D0Y65_001452 [Glycine soja]|uniref:Uncharacterized protein n=1 Tax=Glycine soja TaxID=3848 RepID=A0A445M2Z8_GLYSO|nr:hypothetical protein D0Y65_001452 [Glycine soja]